MHCLPTTQGDARGVCAVQLQCNISTNRQEESKEHEQDVKVRIYYATVYRLYPVKTEQTALLERPKFVCYGRSKLENVEVSLEGYN